MNGYREPQMWWKPSNEKEKKLFESFKTDVKTFLTICKEGVNVRAAYNQMSEQMDGEIRYQDLGFKNFGEFLFHIKDILDVRTDYANGYYLFLRGFADEETEHLRRLVQGQANTKSRTRKFVARLSNTRPCSPNILLELLTRPNHLMPPQSSRPVRFGRGGRGGYRGSRSNYGRTNSRLPRSSNFNSGMNGVPELRPYKPPERSVRPGLCNAVMSQLAADFDSDDSCDDLEDWYWSSTADVKKSDGFHSDGEDVVDSEVNRNGFKTPDEIKSLDEKIRSESLPKPAATAAETKPAITKSNVTVTPMHVMAQQLDATVMPKRLNPFLNKTTTSASPSVSTIPKLVPYIKKTETSVEKEVEVKVVNEVKPQEQVLAAPVVTIPKLVPYASLSKSVSTGGDVVKADGSKVFTTGSETARIVTGSTKEPEKPTKSAALGATQPKLDRPKVIHTTSEPQVELPKSTSPMPKEHVPTVKSLSVQQVIASKPVLPLPKMENAFIKKAQTVQNITVQVGKDSRTVQMAEEVLARRLNVPKDKPFQAKIAGADGFGFLVIQLDEHNINKCFGKLQKDLDDFYRSADSRRDLRLAAEDLHRGQLVVVHHGGHYSRARIFEIQPDGPCLVVGLEDHEFCDVFPCDIYKLHVEKFSRPLPRAILCKLADFSEDYMMFDELANAFEVTPLYPPNVTVKFIKQNDTYGVPEVSMTLDSSGKDVATLIKFHGENELKKVAFESDRKARQEYQKEMRRDLIQSKYLLL